MIHANVIRDPGPCQVGSNETLEQCTKRLSSAERDYFHRRAAQETEAAQAASCTEARLAHEAMAEAYWLLCRSHEGSADPHLASDLSMFLFNSRPTDWRPEDGNL